MPAGFSALQRAEIAEIRLLTATPALSRSFSALQRAEIAEIVRVPTRRCRQSGFSALQRAEIAEMDRRLWFIQARRGVSVLFNEPKLLKCNPDRSGGLGCISFSALQRAEIAEIRR